MAVKTTIFLVLASTPPSGATLPVKEGALGVEALNMSDLILSRRTRRPLSRFTLQYVQTFRAQLRHGI